MRNKLQKMMKDRLIREVLAFFYQNQASIDSVGGISTWVRNDKKAVQSVLNDLVKLGILEEDSTGSAKGYCYTRDKKTMKIVKDLMQDA